MDDYLNNFLGSIEGLHNDPENSEDVEIGLNLNRGAYIQDLLKQNFIPTQELLNLYAVYMNGSDDAWWCKSSLRFREFLYIIKKLDQRELITIRDYRKGFADGIRFILDAMVI